MLFTILFLVVTLPFELSKGQRSRVKKRIKNYFI